MGVGSRLQPLAAGLVALALAGPALAGPGDGPVYLTLASVRAAAEAVVIDGSDADWAGIPAFTDPVGDAAAGPETDIVSVSIAPLADRLLVRIATASAPPTAFLRFWVELDFLSEQFRDLELGLDPTFDDLLWIYPESGPPFAILVSPFEHATLAIGDVVEASIPYAALDAVLPAAMQGKLAGPDARSWVRVRPYAVGPGGVEDHGAAVGSFRLVDTPYPLDPPLPPGAEDALETAVPLAGLQYVGQGPYTRPGRSHHLLWGYDLHRTDNALFPSDPPDSGSNADYFSFGDPLRAPADATVFSLENGQPDDPPGGPAGSANFVFLELPGDVGLLFSHTQQGSIPLTPGQAVTASDPIGAVGHSGSGSFAHLHYEAQDIANAFQDVPLALTDVVVGLNPTPDDPWRRRIPRWDIREGFFVRSAEGAVVPALPPLSRLGVALLLLGVALHRARRRA